MNDDESDEDARTCPDCHAGKHLNCTGGAWDNKLDQPAICACWTDGHRSPLVSD